MTPAQKRAVIRASSTMLPFKGHALKTINSLSKLGLLTYVSKLVYEKRHTVWRIYVELTSAGWEVARQLRNAEEKSR